MKTSDVELILRETMQKLHLNCSEQHGHAVSKGCYSGAWEDIQIARLCNVILTDRDVVKTWIAPVTRGWDG